MSTLPRVMTAAQYRQYVATGSLDVVSIPTPKNAPSHTFGEMNKLERKYSYYLEGLLKAGEIQWYEYELFQLRLAPRTSITIDFLVKEKDGALNLKDTKGGFIREDAMVKLKWAAGRLRGKYGVAIVRENAAKTGFEEQWL
jgi:hypothetical protein